MSSSSTLFYQSATHVGKAVHACKARSTVASDRIRGTCHELVHSADHAQSANEICAPTLPFVFCPPVNFPSGDDQTQETGQVVDIMHYHISPSGQYWGTWSKAAEYYRDIMRYPNRINYITVLREPRSHLLRYLRPGRELSRCTVVVFEHEYDEWFSGSRRRFLFQGEG